MFAVEDDWVHYVSHSSLDYLFVLLVKGLKGYNIVFFFNKNIRVKDCIIPSVIVPIRLSSFTSTLWTCIPIVVDVSV